MKKMIACVLVITFLFALTACSSGGESFSAEEGYFYNNSGYDFGVSNAEETTTEVTLSIDGNKVTFTAFGVTCKGKIFAAANQTGSAGETTSIVKWNKIPEFCTGIEDTDGTPYVSTALLQNDEGVNLLFLFSKEEGYSTAIVTGFKK